MSHQAWCRLLRLTLTERLLLALGRNYLPLRPPLRPHRQHQPPRHLHCHPASVAPESLPHSAMAAGVTTTTMGSSSSNHKGSPTIEGEDEEELKYLKECIMAAALPSTSSKPASSKQSPQGLLTVEILETPLMEGEYYYEDEYTEKESVANHHHHQLHGEEPLPAEVVLAVDESGKEEEKKLAEAALLGAVAAQPRSRMALDEEEESEKIPGPQLSPFLRGELNDADPDRDARIEREVLHRLNERRSFEEALLYWAREVRRLQTESGMDTLLEFSIRAVDEHEGICRDRIRHIRKHMPHFLKPSDFIAHLIASMVVTGFRDAAIEFATLFSIPGVCFVKPLQRVAWKICGEAPVGSRAGKAKNSSRSEQLAKKVKGAEMGGRLPISLMDDFARFIELTYFAELRSRRRKPKREKQIDGESGAVETKGCGDTEPAIFHLFSGAEPIQQAECSTEKKVEKEKNKNLLYYTSKFHFLLPMLGKAPPKTAGQLQARANFEAGYYGAKGRPTRQHEVDVRRLEPLLRLFCKLWRWAALHLGDAAAWKRYETFAAAHSLLPEAKVLRHREPEHSHHYLEEAVASEEVEMEHAVGEAHRREDVADGGEGREEEDEELMSEGGSTAVILEHDYNTLLELGVQSNALVDDEELSDFEELGDHLVEMIMNQHRLVVPTSHLQIHRFLRRAAVPATDSTSSSGGSGDNDNRLGGEFTPGWFGRYRLPFNDPPYIREITAVPARRHISEMKALATPLESLVDSAVDKAKKEHELSELSSPSQLYSLLQACELYPKSYGAIFNKVLKAITRDHTIAASLSERQHVLLVQLGGMHGLNLLVSMRRTYLDRLMRALTVQRVKLGLPVLNALLEANLDNDDGELLDPIAFLQHLRNKGLQPDANTYGQLARLYSLRGNTDAIRSILAQVDSEVALDPAAAAIRPHIVNCLVHSLARTGNYKVVERFLHQHSAHLNSTSAALTKYGVPDEVLAPFFCAALGFATIPDLDATLKTLHSLPSTVLCDEGRVRQYALDVYLTLLQADCLDALEKMGPSFLGLKREEDRLEIKPLRMAAVGEQLHGLLANGQRDAFEQLASILPESRQGWILDRIKKDVALEKKIKQPLQSRPGWEHRLAPFVEKQQQLLMKEEEDTWQVDEDAWRTRRPIPNLHSIVAGVHRGGRKTASLPRWSQPTPAPRVDLPMDRWRGRPSSGNQAELTAAKKWQPFTAVPIEAEEKASEDFAPVSSPSDEQLSSQGTLKEAMEKLVGALKRLDSTKNSRDVYPLLMQCGRVMELEKREAAKFGQPHSDAPLGHQQQAVAPWLSEHMSTLREMRPLMVQVIKEDSLWRGATSIQRLYATRGQKPYWSHFGKAPPQPNESTQSTQDATIEAAPSLSKQSKSATAAPTMTTYSHSTLPRKNTTRPLLGQRFKQPDPTDLVDSQQPPRPLGPIGHAMLELVTRLLRLDSSMSTYHIPPLLAQCNRVLEMEQSEAKKEGRKPPQGGMRTAPWLLPFMDTLSAKRALMANVMKERGLIGGAASVRRFRAQNEKAKRVREEEEEKEKEKAKNSSSSS